MKIFIKFLTCVVTVILKMLSLPVTGAHRVRVGM